jgi:hypothetical protein
MTLLPRVMFVAALVLSPAAASSAVAQMTAQGVANRTVYINAFDDNGASVDGLTAADLELKEGGKVREVSVRPAEGLMQIAVIVDDNGTGLFRAPLYRFLQRLEGRAQFSITTVVGQPLKLTDFTMDGRVLTEVVESLSARPGTPDGGQLMQGIYDAAQELEKREAPRPVIVALSVPGEEHTTVPARYVLDKLRDSGASLHVFLMESRAVRQMAPVSRPSALLEENMNLGEVLGDGSKQSGGRREEIVAATGVFAGLQRLAEDLIDQYEITYSLPAGVKASDRLSVSAKRKGLSIRAPNRIPKD